MHVLYVGGRMARMAWWSWVSLFFQGQEACSSTIPPPSLPPLNTLSSCGLYFVPPWQCGSKGPSRRARVGVAITPPKKYRAPCTRMASRALIRQRPAQSGPTASLSAPAGGHWST